MSWKLAINKSHHPTTVFCHFYCGAIKSPKHFGWCARRYDSNKSDIMNIVELMSAIEKRPGHFLQKDCIFQLRAFLRGYCFAKNVSGGTKELSISQDHRLLTEFDSLIKSKFGYSEKGISVEEILYEKFGKQSFHKYFELWKSHTTKS